MSLSAIHAAERGGEQPAEHPVHASLVRPVLYLGVERHVVAVEGTLCLALLFGVGLSLATLGLVALGAAARREWRGRHDAPPSGSADLASRRRVGPAAFFLCWLAAYSAGVTWGFGMNWDRYAMPLFLPATILSGLGAHLILDWLRLGLAGTRRVVGARAGA